MTTDSYYRTVGDVTIKNKTSTNGTNTGRKVEISYGNKKTTNFDSVAIIQSRQPLTPDAPYFIVEIQKCGKTLRHNYSKK